MSKSIWIVRWIDEYDITCFDSAWTTKDLADKRCKCLEHQFEQEKSNYLKCIECPVNLRNFSSLKEAESEIGKYCNNFKAINWNNDLEYCECGNSSALDPCSKTVLSPTEVTLDPVLEGCER